MDTRQSTYVFTKWWAIQLIKHCNNINIERIFWGFSTQNSIPSKETILYTHGDSNVKNNQKLFNSHLPVDTILAAAPVDQWPLGAAKGG